ncbi:MAG: T9SS type A sorting domain-containing protein [Bacteroidales bacterium]|nr:T9SS type A sorting domain-containing protein [Bacteroidales bacterium]
MSLFKKACLSLILPLFLLGSALAQDLGIGQWRDHLPYNKCLSLAIGGERVYTATANSIFYFDKTDNSLARKNKVNGLSDVGLSCIAYSQDESALVIAYSNTNIDLLKNDVIINIPDIKRKQILGNKTINRITIIGKYAYLSCGFGIVVLDIEREEIHDTYYIGPLGTQINVLSLVKGSDNRFYAATEKGIYSADANSNLAYYVSWTKDTNLPNPDNRFNLVCSFGNKIYANASTSSWNGDTLYVYDGQHWDYFNNTNHSNRSSLRASGDYLLVCNYLNVEVFDASGTRKETYYTYNPGNIRPNDAEYDADGAIWIADNDQGMWEIEKSYQIHQYLINGPVSSQVAAMDVSGTSLWAVPGGRNASFGNLYRSAQYFSFQDESWSSYTETNAPYLHDARDLLCVAADPHDGGHAFIGSWGYGVFEIKDGELLNTYTPANSSLQASIYASDLYFTGGMAFDANQNLWVTNSTAANILSVRKASGDWKSYNLGTYGTGVDVGGVTVDKSNQKWMLMRDFSLLVFNDNNTLDNTADDQVHKLTNAPGNGDLPGNAIASFAVDKEGQLWLGSDQGVAVIYSPENVFNQGNFDAQVVMIEEEGFLHPLLETEAVTAIAVNGNNQKWLGTDKSGVFLMASDGSKQIYHFTEENSPLLSNSITGIRVASDGEVFFGTANGIVSYKDASQPPSAELDSVYVYPNPVREDYTGPIAITNLVEQSDVKITDMSGNKVWETESEGGRVVWDGKDFEGKRVRTGVYLVFISNTDGSKTSVAKILFISN